MEDKDQVITELKALIFAFGEAASNLIEQELKCAFRDEQNHSLQMNKSFLDLADALDKANEYAQQHGAFE